MNVRSLSILIGLALAAFPLSPTPRAAGAETVSKTVSQATLGAWQREWPDTDFSKHLVPLAEIQSGGPPKDGIPAIDRPRFASVDEVDFLSSTEPVIGLTIGGEAKAYPLQILTWHEIVNDTLGGVPITVTYCPLCNAAIVFDRRVGGRVLDFGVSGKLRYSDMIMYDRRTESWWQQFEGRAVVGALAGMELEVLPSRLESFERFKARFPDGRVLLPPSPPLRPYGQNPYAYYDRQDMPFLYDGPLPEGVPAMARVVIVEGQAWTLALLREHGRIEVGDLVLEWVPGQASALDTPEIAEGRDVGNVMVTRNDKDVDHDITFAFVYKAFHPEGNPINKVK